MTPPTGNYAAPAGSLHTDTVQTAKRDPIGIQHCCPICTHPLARRIERDLIDGLPKATVTKRWSVGMKSLDKHIKHGHLRPLLEQAQRDRRVSALTDLTDAVRGTVEQAQAVMSSTHDPDIRLKAIAAEQRGIELAGRLTGQIGPTNALFVALGVRDERELRAAVELYRSGDDMTIADCRDEAMRLLDLVLDAEPSWLEPIMAVLQGKRRLLLPAAEAVA